MRRSFLVLALALACGTTSADDAAPESESESAREPDPCSAFSDEQSCRTAVVEEPSWSDGNFACGWFEVRTLAFEARASEAGVCNPNTPTGEFRCMGFGSASAGCPGPCAEVENGAGETVVVQPNIRLHDDGTIEVVINGGCPAPYNLEGGYGTCSAGSYDGDANASECACACATAIAAAQ